MLPKIKYVLVTGMCCGVKKAGVAAVVTATLPEKFIDNQR